MSENYRISNNADSDVLRVYKRVVMKNARDGKSVPRNASRSTTKTLEDDTAAAAASSLVGAGVRSKLAGKRAAATAAERAVRKQPLRKRMFFGWMRR